MDDRNTIYTIFVATSTSPQHILDSDRTIAAPVDYEGNSSWREQVVAPLATTFNFVDADGTDADDAAGASAGPPGLPTPPPVTARAVTSRQLPSGDAMCCDEH
jgi:hypothetical protein